MAQKGRAELDESIGSNIYDNNNKEIDAAKVRFVLDDFKESKFNLKDDELKNVTYKIEGDTKITLEDYLNSVVGAIPIYGTVLDVNIGDGDNETYSTNGIVSSAKALSAKNEPDLLLEINFSQSVANRRLIPVMTTTSSNWNYQNDICAPVVRRISSTRINLAIRELNAVAQSLNIEIIAL